MRQLLIATTVMVGIVLVNHAEPWDAYKFLTLTLLFAIFLKLKD